MNPSLHSLHSTSADVSERPTGTALVLGGGGAAGNAWLIGTVAGLYETGLDVTEADLIIGTSAGSTAAAQITHSDPARLLADVLAAAPPEATRPAASGRAPLPRNLAAHLTRLDETIAAAADPADLRRRMGAVLAADAASEGSACARWRDTVAARLPSPQWPRQRVLITAVDAATGEPVEFDRRSGVDLVDAVAASCAGGFVYNIGAGRYIDGGYRSNADNADLAAGYARVLVLSPLGGRSRTPVGWGVHLATQVEELRASGSRVETVFPDSDSLAAFGANLMDPSTRPPAARAGYDQGRGLAERLTELWC